MKGILLVLFFLAAVLAPRARVWADDAAQLPSLETAVDTMAYDLGAASSAGPTCKAPEGRKRPDKSQLTALAQTLEGIGQNPANALRDRAIAYNLLSRTDGLVVACYIGFFHFSERAQLGKIAYFAIKTATQIDPTDRDAWVGYGEAILDIQNEGMLRSTIESSLGIDLKDEIQNAISGLEKFSGNELGDEGLRVLNQLRRI